MLNILVLFSFLAVASSCTLNIIQTSTHAPASDVVDDAASAQADIKPNIEIPVKPI